MLATCPECMGQQSVSGTVVDSVSGGGLEKATVMLIRQGKTLKFSRTDGQGRFTLAVAPQEGDTLQATLMGYAKHRQAVGGDNVIRLSEQAFQLREVKVQGAPVQARRDTVTYDLTRFATDRDNTLKDVLKKLPGVDVEKNGEIKYNGKTLSRFTVEGLDLSKGQYNKLTENIRAKDVKKAEVVEHDQPIKALRNRVFTDNVGMNIVLKDSARDQLAVTLRPYVLVGEPTGVGGDAVAMQIGKRKQMEYTAQYDRTGRDLNNQFSIFYNFWDYAAIADPPKWYTAPSLQAPIDEERLRRNTSQAYSVDYLAKNHRDEENSLSVSYNRNVIRQHTQNVSQYFLDGRETPEVTTENQHMTLRQDAFSMDYTHRINAEKHFGSIVLKANAAQDDGLSDLETTWQRVRTPELNLTAAVSQTYTLRTGLLRWKSTVDYHHSKDALYLHDASAADSLSTEEGPRLKFAQADNLWHTAHQLGWNKQRGRWHRDYSLQLEAEDLNTLGTDNVLLAAALRPSWYYHDDDWRINLSPNATLKRYTHQQATLLLPQASLNVNRNYGNRADWNLSALYTESTSAWNVLAAGDRQTNYRTWTDSPDFVPRQRMFTSTFAYNYKRAIYQFFASARLSYGHQWNNAAQDMVISDGRYRYTWTRHDTHGDNISGSMNVSKGWHRLHLKTNLGVTATYADGQQYSGGRSLDYAFTSYSLTPQVIFSPSWMEIEYKGSFSFNRSKADGEWMHTLADWTQRIALTSTVKHVDISVGGTLYHNEIANSPSVNTLLADASLTWRLKRVRLRAELRNAFNKKSYSETTYSGIGIFTNRYELRPRELLVSAQFSL